jgi:hypothetical protein
VCSITSTFLQGGNPDTSMAPLPIRCTSMGYTSVRYHRNIRFTPFYDLVCAVGSSDFFSRSFGSAKENKTILEKALLTSTFIQGGNPDTSMTLYRSISHRNTSYRQR